MTESFIPPMPDPHSQRVLDLLIELENIRDANAFAATGKRSVDELMLDPTLFDSWVDEATSRIPTNDGVALWAQKPRQQMISENPQYKQAHDKALTYFPLLGCGTRALSIETLHAINQHHEAIADGLFRHLITNSFGLIEIDDAIAEYRKNIGTLNESQKNVVLGALADFIHEAAYVKPEENEYSIELDRDLLKRMQQTLRLAGFPKQNMKEALAIPGYAAMLKQTEQFFGKMSSSEASPAPNPELLSMVLDAISQREAQLHVPFQMAVNHKGRSKKTYSLEPVSVVHPITNQFSAKTTDERFLVGENNGNCVVAPQKKGWLSKAKDIGNTLLSAGYHEILVQSELIPLNDKLKLWLRIGGDDNNALVVPIEHNGIYRIPKSLIAQKHIDPNELKLSVQTNQTLLPYDSYTHSYSSVLKNIDPDKPIMIVIGSHSIDRGDSKGSAESFHANIQSAKRSYGYQQIITLSSCTADDLLRFQQAFNTRFGATAPHLSIAIEGHHGNTGWYWADDRVNIKTSTMIDFCNGLHADISHRKTILIGCSISPERYRSLKGQVIVGTPEKQFGYAFPTGGVANEATAAGTYGLTDAEMTNMLSRAPSVVEGLRLNKIDPQRVKSYALPWQKLPPPQPSVVFSDEASKAMQEHAVRQRWVDTAMRSEYRYDPNHPDLYQTIPTTMKPLPQADGTRIDPSWNREYTSPSETEVQHPQVDLVQAAFDIQNGNPHAVADAYQALGNPTSRKSHAAIQEERRAAQQARAARPNILI